MELPQQFLLPLRPIELPKTSKDRRVVLSVENRSLLPELRERYSSPIRIRLRSLLGREVRLEFRPAADSGERNTFANFLVGKSNRVACSAALAAAKTPGRDGPVYLYGTGSVGKSHLAEAVAYEFEQNGLVVLTLRGRERYGARNGVPDLLVVDDVETTLAPPTTKRHTVLLKACRERGTQLLVTGQRGLAKTALPADLKQMLSGGIQAALESPEPELRRRFLDERLAGMNIVLPSGWEERLLGTREAIGFATLCAVAKKLTFLHRNESLPTDDAIWMQLLAEFIDTDKTSSSPQEKPKTVDATKILEAVAAEFGVAVADILGTSRKSQLTLPRHTAMHLAVQLTDLNKSAVARFFRRNDHSTVINAERNVLRRIQRDAEFARIVGRLRLTLTRLPS